MESSISAVMVVNDQPIYPRLGRAFTYSYNDDTFVVALVKLFQKSSYEDPCILHDGISTIERIYGHKQNNSMMVVYHAESEERAQSLLSTYHDGNGYSIDDTPVIFHHADPTSDDISRVEEIIADYYKREKVNP